MNEPPLANAPRPTPAAASVAGSGRPHDGIDACRCTCRCALGGAASRDPAAPVRVLGFDQALLWVTVALLAWGLVMVYSASIAMPDNPRFRAATPTPSS
jgi:cell division protein FtsW